MKKQALAVAVALGMSVVAASQAQTRPRVMVTNIPFQFEAGGVRLPAGQYGIEFVTTGSGTIERIQQVDGKASAQFSSITAEPREADGAPQLVFHRYGNSNFLSEIRTGDGRALVLLQSKQEQEAAHAQRSAGGQAVSVAAVVR
jgi:hypothetical protein